MNWLYLFLAIVAETLGTSFLKMSNGFSQFLPSILAILCFLVALFLSSIVLKFLPVGIVYAIWSGLGIALVTIVGYLFFKQSLDLPALIGIALILLGVVVIFTMSNTQTE